jgi:hypothetical protein
VYVVNNALPLHERRRRKFWFLLAYFGSLPPALVASLSAAKATALRKALLTAMLVALFGEYRRSAAHNPAYWGERFVDARGTLQHVHVRVQNLIFDYPVVAAWTMTLQNRACFCCARLAGTFHLFAPKSRARSTAREKALVEQAFADHPHSRAARADSLRPHGLHPERNPLWALSELGLDPYLGITFSPLHMIYEGIWKVIVEGAFALVFASMTRSAFSALGRRIDAWIVTHIAPTPFRKTGFGRGISHYFYASLVHNNPWEVQVRFGKINPLPPSLSLSLTLTLTLTLTIHPLPSHPSPLSSLIPHPSPLSPLPTPLSPSHPLTLSPSPLSPLPSPLSPLTLSPLPPSPPHPPSHLPSLPPP